MRKADDLNNAVGGNTIDDDMPRVTNALIRLDQAACVTGRIDTNTINVTNIRRL